MGEKIYVSYQANAKYLGHLVEELKKNHLEPVLPTEIITMDNRELNINAFDSLKKRSPRNPYVLRLKRAILENEIGLIKQSTMLLIFNPLGVKSGHISSQQLIALTVAWQNNIPRYLLESPDPMNEYYEEVLSMEPIIIKGNVGAIKTIQKFQEAVDRPITKKPDEEKLSIRYKLQRRDEN